MSDNPLITKSCNLDQNFTPWIDDDFSDALTQAQDEIVTDPVILDLDCPSGENQFYETANDANHDDKMQPSELDAIIACNYGQYFPHRPMTEMTPEALHNDGLISDPGDMNQVDTQFHRNERNLAQAGVFIHNQQGFTRPAPEKAHKLWNDYQDHPSAIGTPAAGIASQQQGVAFVNTSRTGSYSGLTGTHEALHLYSHPVMQDRSLVPEALAEGLTESTAYIIMDEHMIDNVPQSGYDDWTREAYRLRGIVGDNVVDSAYFGGDITTLQQKFEERVGPGSWQIYTDVLNITPPENLQSTIDVMLIGKPDVIRDGFLRMADYETAYDTRLDDKGAAIADD